MDAILITAFLMLTASDPNFSESASMFDGNKLHALCVKGRAAQSMAAEKECLGYIIGVVDSHMLSSAGLGVPPMVCLPKIVSNDQLLDIVTKDLRDNPSERHYGASSSVLESLMRAFPCAAKDAK